MGGGGEENKSVLMMNFTIVTYNLTGIWISLRRLLTFHTEQFNRLRHVTEDWSLKPRFHSSNVKLTTQGREYTWHLGLAWHSTYTNKLLKMNK